MLDKHIIDKKLEELDLFLRENREDVLTVYGDETEKRGYRKDTIHSFHGLIMSKNSGRDIFVDLVRTQVLDFEEYLSLWLLSLKNKASEYRDSPYNKEMIDQKIDYIIIDLLRHELMKKYIFALLEKNFYKNYRERIRFKPKENLWNIWFGDSKLFWGLFITPRFNGNEWENDKSEIRRVKFDYWTVGHILQTGLVDLESEEKLTFNSVQELLKFYSHILKKYSSSEYEKGIYERYLDYLRKSKDIKGELLLIPELRFGGESKKHEYRIDFSILNPHTGKYIGFELSPSSSHMSISGIRAKTQVELNENLKKKWEKESKKRNDFFEQYEIPIITFTDSDLLDLDKCFNKIREYLVIRKEGKNDIEKQLEELL